MTHTHNTRIPWSLNLYTVLPLSNTNVAPCLYIYRCIPIYIYCIPIYIFCLCPTPMWPPVCVYISRYTTVYIGIPFCATHTQLLPFSTTNVAPCIYAYALSLSLPPLHTHTHTASAILEHQFGPLCVYICKS